VSIAAIIYSITASNLQNRGRNRPQYRVRRPMKNPDQVDLARAFLRSEELLALPHMPIQAE
jgi:hypothetical protein